MDPTETARRVIDLDRQATQGPWVPWIVNDRDEGAALWIATSSCHNADEAQAKKDAVLIAEYRTAAPELARALLESQAALAAATEGVHAACGNRHGEGACVLETVALVRERTAERDEARAQVARVTAERDEVRDRLSEVVPVLNRVIEERDAALATAERFAKYVDAVAPLAAPTPADAKATPAAVPGLAFGEPTNAGVRFAATVAPATYSLRKVGRWWVWTCPEGEYAHHDTESEAIAAANAHNAARLAGVR